MANKNDIELDKMVKLLMVWEVPVTDSTNQGAWYWELASNSSLALYYCRVLKVKSRDYTYFRKLFHYFDHHHSRLLVTQMAQYLHFFEK